MPVLELSAKIPQHEGRDDEKLINRKVFESKKSEKFFFFSQKSRKSEDECKVLSHVGGMMMKTNGDDDDSFFSVFLNDMQSDEAAESSCG